jgi:hypothetical protein
MRKEEIVNMTAEFLKDEAERIRYSEFSTSTLYELADEFADKIIELHEKGCEYN